MHILGKTCFSTNCLFLGTSQMQPVISQFHVVSWKYVTLVTPSDFEIISLSVYNQLDHYFFFHMSLCFSHITYSVLISLSLSSSLSLSLSSICLSLIIFLITICLSYHFFFFSKNVIHLVEDVAEAASRALWRKNLGSSSHQGTMRFYNNDGLENHIIETLQQDLQEDADLYADLNAAVRTIPTTLSRKRTIKYVPSFSSPALPSFYFCFTPSRLTKVNYR